MSPSGFSSGVTIPRTSVTGAKAETTRLRGAATVCSSPPLSRHTARMERLSLPTGIDTPRAGQNSRPTARTVSKRAASSPSSPQAHIQLADSFTFSMAPTGAAARLVTASATARRAAAGPSTRATGVRSPMAMTAPVWPRNPVRVAAQSETGTCQRPTIWSRAMQPPTVRSAMVMRKLLAATAGKRSTR